MIEFSDYVVYVDESGDHELAKTDPAFPIFVLTFCLFRVDDYITTVVPALQRIKFRHFGHDMVVLHEREIRKAERPFAFPGDKARRDEFMADVSGWVAASPFVIVAAVVRKGEFAAGPAAGNNVYHLAMKFGLEGVDDFLRRHGQWERTTHVVFEARGKKEDAALELEFRRVCERGNYLGRSYPFRIVFPGKQINSAGLQLADLTARPIGRHVLEPDQPNRAFQVITAKLDRGPSGEVEGYGLKCYPDKTSSPGVAPGL